jgi:predicted nucleic acid-binding protein
MIVVSDTTVLSTLFLMGRLDWLEQLFGQVIIPQSVFNELLELESFGHDVSVFKKASWFVVESASNQQLIADFSKELDLGESEAIVLALEKKADFLLIDERKGTRKATELGLQTIGLLRVVIELKDRKIISVVRPYLDAMRQTGGFWISDRLYSKVLESAGE